MKYYHSIALAVCLVILTAAFVLKANPQGVTLFGFNVPGQCMLYNVFGIKCAFCGMTRAFCMCAKGDFSQATMLNRLGPVLFCFMVLQVPYRIWALTRVGDIKIRKIEKYNLTAGLVIGCAVIINWLIYLGGTFL